MSPDPIFADRRLASLYDVVEGERPDLEAYDDWAGALGARSVLDVGCGTGSLAVRLAARGLSVVGVDPALASLEVARAKSGAVTWVHGTVSDVGPLQADLALMTGNVAQVFLGDDLTEVLREIRARLRPDGHVLFETRVPSAAAWLDWTPERTRRRIDVPALGPVESWCELLSTDLPLVSFRWNYAFSDGTVLTSDSTLRFRSRLEVEAALSAGGLEVVEVRDAPDRPGLEHVFLASRA